MARLDRFRPLDPGSMLPAVTAMLEANERFYAGFRVRCVAYRDEDIWRNALCVIQAFLEGELPATESSRRYEKLRLLEEWVDREGVLSLVRGAIERRVTVDGEQVVCIVEGANRYTSNLHGNNEHAPYPGRQFVTIVQPRGFQDEPHLAYDLPPYPTLDAAARDWMGLDMRNRDSTTRMGFVYLFLPECRARFADASYANGKLSLRVASEVAGLRVKGVWRTNEVSQHFECGVVGDTGESDVPADAEALELFLIGPDETLYDWHRESPSGLSGIKRILADHLSSLANESIVKQARLEGEGESVEFKVYVQPGDNNERELVETAIAFANWKGGNLLIGVDDYGEVKGIEQHIVKKAQPNLMDAITNETGRLRKLFSDTINQTVLPEFAHVREAGHSVLLVKIPKGENGPYFRQEDNAIFIRRGATNRRPDPVHELPRLLVQQGWQGGIEGQLAGLTGWEGDLRR